FRNGPSNTCVNVTLDAPTATFGLSAAAYLNNYDPANVCSNYLADSGSFAATNTGPQTFSFNAAANASFVVVVLQATSASTPYTLAVSGGDCRPALNIAKAGNQVALDWTTAAPGYLLESTNSLVTPPPNSWQPVPNVPAVLNNRFRLTNNIDVDSASRFYRLRKP